MPRIQAYSSVSVSDYSDIGSINFYLTSNLPNSVIYDPNQSNGTYSPNWASSNLVITPVISYNGSNLSLTATGLVISFTRKEGTGSATALTTGEAVSNGVLTVSNNKMSGVTSGQLTYICDVTYTDPEVGVPITAQASLTYTLVRMATNLKYASILGETAFLYDTNRAVIGTGQITLTAELTNCSVSQWQYKNSLGNFVAFPTTYNESVTTDTLIVKANEANIWLNDGKTAIIKLVTDANDIYDVIQIVKIYDGASGNATIAAVLSNESQMVPAASDGTIASSTWSGINTEIHIYEGGNDVTNDWTISVTNGTGLSGSYNSTTHVYAPSGLTVDTSYADFVCTQTGYATITKRYYISRLYSGADGQDAVIYELDPDVYVLNRSEAGVLSPNSVTFSAYTKTGNATVRTAYSGRFIIEESSDGTTYTTAYTSSSNEYSKVWTPSSGSITTIRCTLYAAGGTSQQLDTQSVVVTRDGATGQNGTNGTDGLSMGLCNYSDVIPCNSSGNAAEARTITIPFYAYKGIVRVAVTATTGTLPTGVTVQSNSAGTVSANGQLVLAVANGATFGSSSLMSGDITITLTAEGRTADYKYTWTKSKQAVNGTNGENAVLLQLYSTDGGDVATGKDTTISLKLTSGSTDVTPTSVAWAAFSSGSYQTISGQTGTSITITSAMVSDEMWLRCTATYGGNTYVAYHTVHDLDDIDAYTFATVAEFKNSQGFGAIYTRVYKGGVEIDPIKSTTFSNTAPTSAQSGDFYYHLNTTSKTCVLKKYNGSAWQNATSADNDTYTYKYYRINNAGESIDTSSAWKTGRCQYIDPSIINGRMQFICEVSDS